MKITWKNKEMKNRAARVACAVVVIIVCLGVLPIAIVATLPLHFVLRVCGRRGFVRPENDGSTSYAVNFDGFKKPLPAICSE